MHLCRYTKLLTINIATIAITLILVSIPSATLASADGPAVSGISKCPTNGKHWYGRAVNTTAHTSSTAGTEIIVNMPSSYFAPKGSTTDEAGWIFNIRRLIQGLPASSYELGWFNGRWPYPGMGYGTQFTTPHGYSTTDDGKQGVILTGKLAKGHKLEFESADAGEGVTGTIKDLTAKHLLYGNSLVLKISTPRGNLSQGEVTIKTGAWMGGNGGKGSVVTGYYQVPDTANFVKFHSFGMCDNKPYFIKRKGTGQWQNGGK